MKQTGKLHKVIFFPLVFASGHLLQTATFPKIVKKTQIEG